MAIDWTQTLMGTSAFADPAGGDAATAADAAPRLAGARLLGVLVGSLAMGLSLATLPFRGLAEILPEWIALSGVLAASVCGFVLLNRPNPVTRIAGLFSGLLVLPFAAIAGNEPQVLALLALLGAALGLADWLVLNRRSGPARLVAGMAVLATLACFLQWPLTLAAVAPAMACTLPLAIAACRRPAPEEANLPARDEGARLRRLEALQAMVLRGSPRQVLVLDQVGAIDTGGESLFRRHLVETHFPEGSVVAATLIADRVPLLQALSRAIHQQEASGDMHLRLRRDPAGAGFPVPPRFDAYCCRVEPLAGEPGLAAFVFEPAEAVAPSAAPATRVDGALVSRALHDSIAPFNAGLGFLEMLADPRLAPRDQASWHDFAAEAHKAISEAHRNTHLLGRWLRIGQDEASEPADILPSRLLSDAARTLNLRDALDRGLIRLEAPAGMPAARLPLPAARFAVEIMLRRAMALAGSSLEWLREGADLVLVCRDAPEAGPRPVDPLERALCQALAREPGIGFSAVDGRTLSLRFAEAYAGRLPGSLAAESRGAAEAPMRLAV